MSQFILVDHSLQKAGGHHYEYALQILKAAEDAGYRPVLATHQRFDQRATLPESWAVHSLFEYDTFSKYTRFAELDRLKPCGRASLRIQWPWSRRHEAKRRTQRTVAFASGLSLLFESTPLSAGDQVFIPTLSELELLGLGRYLHRDGRAKLAQWHVQFHFPIYVGREPDYARQDRRLTGLKAAMDEALKLAEGFDLKIYTTTEPLTEQYSRLGVPGVQTLPYPIHPIFQPPAHAVTAPETLSIRYVGDARAEKGYQYLPDLVDELWESYVEPGVAKFHIQSNFGFPTPTRGKNAAVVRARETLQRREGDKLQLGYAALSSDDYARAVLASDIGLLLYDSHRYYVRCSGIFTEMLTAGIPVLVSDANWMSDQLAEATWDHHAKLQARVSAISTLHSTSIPWTGGRFRRRSRLVDGRLQLGSRSAPATCQLSVPAGATHLLVSTAWNQDYWDAWRGAYIGLETEFLGDDEVAFWNFDASMGRPARPRPVTAIIPLAAEASQLRLNWCNAHGSQPLTIDAPRFTFLQAESAWSLPLGAAGLITPRPDRAAILLKNLVDHFDHYRATAIEFGRGFQNRNHPRNIVDHLVGGTGRAKVIDSPPMRRKAG